jgi:hypothetical protein
MSGNPFADRSSWRYPSKLIEIMGIHFSIFRISVALPWDFEEQIP